jgi:hypothetical protein
MAGGHPIFVVGAPRTGTTLVKNVLNRHPLIHLFDEVHFFERIYDDRDAIGDMGNPRAQSHAIQRLRGIVREFGSDQRVAEHLTMEVFRRRLLSEGGGYRGLLATLLKAGAELEGAMFWGDSSPQDILYLDTIHRWFPDARIVALVRDPRGFLASYKNYYRRGVPTYRERYDPLTNGMLWRSYMKALLDAREEPWGSAILSVRYEDLARDPDTQVRRICEHVGVDYLPGMAEVDRTNTSFVDAAPAEAGIVATSVDRWRNELTPTEIWIGERIFGAMMTRFEYAPFSNGERPLKPSVLQLARILAVLPGRLYNTLFRTAKPFKMSKLKRVLGLFRAS